MAPIPVVPQQVPVATVRRLDGAVEDPVPVQQVAVARVTAPTVVPRQTDRLSRR